MQMRLQNDRNAIRIEIDSLFGRAEIYEKERRKRMAEGNREITKEAYSDLCLRQVRQTEVMQNDD